MGAGVELATAYLSLAPSMDGFAPKVVQGFRGVEQAAGKEGDKAGSSFGKRFAGKLGTLLKGGAIAGGALLAKGLVDSMGNEKTGDKLAAQLGAEGQWAKDVGSIAGKLYANAYGENLGEVNDALKNVLQQGLVPEDATNAQIERVTAKAMDLAETFDQDVAGAAGAVGTLMRTGLAKDADEAFDVITRGFQQGVDKQGDFLDTLTEYPTLFRNLGLDAKAATGLLSQGLDAGARDADKVADSLKEFSIRAVDGSKLTAEGFKAIGLDAAEMAATIAKGGPEAAGALDLTLDRLRAIEDPVKRSQAAVALFGTQAEDLGDALYALDPSSASKALGDVAGAADRMGNTLNDNAATKIESFKRRALQGLANFVGNKALPALSKLGDWASKNLPKAMDAARPYVDRFRQGFEQVVGWVRTNWPQVQQTINTVLATARTYITSFVALVTAIWRTFGDDILGFVRRAWEPMQMIIRGVLTVVQGIIATVTGLIRGDWSAVWNGIKQIFRGVWQAIQGIVRLGAEYIRTYLAVAWQIVRGAVQRAWDGVKTAIGNAWNAITRTVSSKVESVKSTIRSGFSTVKGLITAPVNDARDWVGRAIDGIVNFFYKLPGRIKNVMSSLASFVSAPFKAAADAIRSAWNSTIGGKGVSIPDIPGLPGRGKRFEIPRLHTGGPVTGPAGSEQLRILEAGEWVLSRQQVAALRSAPAPAPAPSGVGRTGPAVQFGDVHLHDGVDLDLLNRKTSFAASFGGL